MTSFSVNLHHFPVDKNQISVQITEISVNITEISVGMKRNFGFWIQNPFRSELAKFIEISAEIPFPADGGIRLTNEKENPAPTWAVFTSLPFLQTFQTFYRIEITSKH